MKNKKYALELLKEKINGQRIITYEQIAEMTKYSKRQIINFFNEIENKDIDSMLIHEITLEKNCCIKNIYVV